MEAALSDIVLLGTEEQVRLAVHAASEMVAGRRVEVKALVVSLRGFIHQALDLDPMPADLHLPDQGLLRLASGSARTGGANRAGGQQGQGGGGRGGSGGGGGAGMCVGGLGGMAAHASDDRTDYPGQ